MHYVLFHEVAHDYVSKRAPFRDEHLEEAWKASKRGELLLGGASEPAADGALLLFRGASPEVAERFARADPCVTSGVVRKNQIGISCSVVFPVILVMKTTENRLRCEARADRNLMTTITKRQFSVTRFRDARSECPMRTAGIVMCRPLAKSAA
jgi:uncharacterized protein